MGIEDFPHLAALWRVRGRQGQCVVATVVFVPRIGMGNSAPQQVSCVFFCSSVHDHVSSQYVQILKFLLQNKRNQPPFGVLVLQFHRGKKVHH